MNRAWLPWGWNNTIKTTLMMLMLSSTSTLFAEESSEDSSEETEEEDAAGGNAALAAGGIVNTGSTFPLNLTTSLNNAVGIGTFAPANTRNPSWQTTLSFNGALKLPKMKSGQGHMVTAGMSFNLEWLDNFSGAFNGAALTAFPRQVTGSDLRLGYMLPNLLSAKWASYSFTPAFRVVVPIGWVSRQQSRLIGGGVALRNQISKVTKGGMAIGGIYTPSVTLWSMHQTGIQVDGSTVDENGALSGTICSSANFNAGACTVPGRQQRGNASQSLTGFLSKSGKTSGNHTFSMTLGTWHLIATALDRSDDELSSPNAASGVANNVSDFTFADISYTWGLPTDLNLQMTAGLSTFQPFYRLNNNFRFPLFDTDLARGGNNYSTIYINTSLSL